MKVENFVIGLHSGLGRVSKPNPNKDFKGYLQQRQTNLVVQGPSFVIGSADGNRFLQAISTILQNAYKSEGLPITSRTRLYPFHSH